MISIKGEAKQLSFDHKPQNDSAFPRSSTLLAHLYRSAVEEKSRIVAAGGYIEYGRVNGSWIIQCAFLTPELLFR